MALIGTENVTQNTTGTASNAQTAPYSVVYQLPTRKEQLLQTLQLIATILTIVIAVRVLFFKHNS